MTIADQAHRIFVLLFNLWPTFSETKNDADSLVGWLAHVQHGKETSKPLKQRLHGGYITNVDMKWNIWDVL